MGKKGWDGAKTAADKHTATGKFCRLENDGDKVIVAFVGDPFSREVVWNESTNRYEEAPAGEKSNLRVTINVYNLAQKKVQIFEGGVTWFRQVLAVRDKYGLDNWYFEITRQGAKGNPKTTYTIFPETKIDDASKKDLAALELFDLEVESSKSDDDEPATTGAAKPANGSNGSSGDKLIDPDVASRLVARLKELPDKDAPKQFVKTFGVERVRDIPFSKQSEAVAAVDALVKSSAPVEIDPFS